MVLGGGVYDYHAGRCCTTDLVVQIPLDTITQCEYQGCFYSCQNLASRAHSFAISSCENARSASSSHTEHRTTHLLVRPAHEDTVAVVRLPNVDHDAAVSVYLAVRLVVEREPQEGRARNDRLAQLHAALPIPPANTSASTFPPSLT